MRRIYLDSWREIFKSQRNLFYGKKEEGNNLHQEYKPKNRCIKCGANDSIEIMKKNMEFAISVVFTHD